MKATVSISKNRQISNIDKRIFGSFIEHLGRAVYGGIYEPGHETADDMGFRQDVLKLVKELDVPVVRYPGGNFVSGYNWEDGTGPRENRPVKLELAWRSIEPNEVGIDEFQEWAKRADTEVMMAINLGTRRGDDARNLVEYCNFPGGSYYSDMRIKNGFPEPFDIKLWCLGNEMDGPWQIGHKNAEDYAKVAAEAAHMMRLVDPSIELVACGSSSFSMETFGEWERTVLEHTYNEIDYISLHTYYGNYEDDIGLYLARSAEFENFIKSVVSICDAVKSSKHSQKTINLSFDEWNVWYRTPAENPDPWTVAPPLLEDIYNFEDALLVSGMMIALLRNADRVKIACLAQLVNVIAPIMTRTGGGVWMQTIFYPYYHMSRFGRGIAMDATIECETYNAHTNNIPYIDCVPVWNQQESEITVFMLNRSTDSGIDVSLDISGFGEVSLIEHIEMTHNDLKAVNTEENPENVIPDVCGNTAINGNGVHSVIKPLSWNVIRFKIN